MASEKAEKSQAPFTIPDLEDCAMVVVMNHRKGMFVSWLPIRQNRRVGDGEVERYKRIDLRFKPGLNLAPKEHIALMRSQSKAYDKAWAADGFMELIGSSKDWLKHRERECVKMVCSSGDLPTLENLLEVEEREAVADSLRDEIAARKKDSRIQDEVLREQRRAKRRNAS